MKKQSDSRLADVASDYIPFPSIILFGCAPFVPRRPQDGTCSTCRKNIGKPRKLGTINGAPALVPEPLDEVTYCARCDALSHANEARARRGKTGLTAKEADDIATRDAARALEKNAKVELSEADRRRLWNGYKGGLLEPLAKVTNRSKAGRDFLKSINQIPDWSLLLDSRGRIVGRKPTVEPAPAEPQDTVLATV